MTKKRIFILIPILVFMTIIISCSNESKFEGIWHIRKDYNAEYLRNLIDAGLDLELRIYTKESRFEIWSATGPDDEYKKMNEGKLGKYEWLSEYLYFQLPDKETGDIMTGYFKYYSDNSLHYTHNKMETGDFMVFTREEPYQSAF